MTQFNTNPLPGRNPGNGFIRIRIGKQDLFQTGDGRLKSAAITLAEGESGNSCFFDIYDAGGVIANRYFQHIYDIEGLTPLNSPNQNRTTGAPTNGTASGEFSPRLRAFLDTIAFCEGGDYNVRFGGSTFDSYADHPRPRGRSSASGRYQILASTFDDVKDDVGVTDFTPQSQDRIAVYLIDRRNALEEVEAGDIDAAIALLENEWTSLPGAAEERKTLAEFREYYEQRLALYQPGGQEAQAATDSVADSSNKTLDDVAKIKSESGSQITVELGFRGESLIAHSFLHTSLDYDRFTPYNLTFGGQAATWVLTQRIRNTAYINVNLRQIAEKICQSYGLVLEMEGDGPDYEYFPQRGVSDYEALLIEARRIGYRVYCRGNRLILKPRSGDTQVFVLEYGDNAGLTFRVRHSAQSDSSGGARSSTPGQTTSTGEVKFEVDQDTGQQVEVRSDTPIGAGATFGSTAVAGVGSRTSTTGAAIARVKPRTKGSTDTLDNSRRENELRIKGIIADFEFPTTPEALLITPDTPLITKGWGSFLDRVWVIETITHSYQVGKFTTSGTCYSPMKNRFPPPVGSTSSTPTASNPGGFIRPAEGRLSSGFRTARRPNHQGVDIANVTGTPIVAAASGTVTFVGFDSGGYGNWIEVDHGNGFRTRYGHLSSSNVTVGQQVQQGQIIARMGSTGRSTGPHLHFEIRLNDQPQDPESYI